MHDGPLTATVDNDTILIMNSKEVDRRLGIQLWCERDDSPERVDQLVSLAAASGFGQLRIFLMWPWIQEASDSEWNFALWDSVFDAASRHGIKIKATLTANSGPWWLGTPSVLHSHTLSLRPDWIEAQNAYIRASVGRYADHPALGQWILWNEPNYDFNVQHSGRPFLAREAWTELLSEGYDHDIFLLNRRWRTGYGKFTDVPFVEDIAHPAHAASHWRSWRPMIDDYTLRSQLLEDEVRRVAEVVRELDPHTPLCINPNQTLNNHAQYGYRLERLASSVEVLGASFHAPWSFADFASVDDHAALVVAGVGLLRNTPGGHATEVTEVQTGNTFYAGVNPLGVGTAEIASSFLAPLLAGAESVTGWCFNTRRPDFEAGEWALLNDDDSINDRTKSISHLRSVLGRLDNAIGTWAPPPYDALVMTSERSHAVQFAMSQNTDTPWSRRATAAIHGSSLAVVELNRLGVRAALAELSAPIPPSATLLVALDIIAWDEKDADRLLDAAHAGATVLIDGTTGQFDNDIVLHRPWPGRYAQKTGLRSLGLRTSVTGHTSFGVRYNGRDLGVVTGVRAAIEVETDAWSAVEPIVYAHDSLPVVWQRTWGRGRLIYTSASLATSMLEPGSPREVAAAVLAIAADQIDRVVRPLSPATTVLSVVGDTGLAHGVFAPEISRRRGEPFAVSISPGRYVDLWTDDTHTVSASQILQLRGADGIALLVEHRSTGEVSSSRV